MGRPEHELDPEHGPVERLAWELRQLRNQGGRPSYRLLAQRAHFSASTLAEAAKGKRLPSLEVAVAYATACGGDPAEWAAKWRAAATELERGNAVIRCPYPGLSPLSATDADLFFGRMTLLDTVLAGVERAALVAVLGASGSGKSSLLLAGVVPALVDRGASPIVLTPGDRPARALASAVAAATGQETERLDAELSREPAALDIALGGPPVGRFVLVVDQFEEIFTYCTSLEERQRFLDALIDVVCARNSRVTVVLAIRADFYAHCMLHSGLVAVLRDSVQVPVGPVTTEELREIVIEPAARVGLSVEHDLVSAVVADANGQPGALPLVAHALRETWNRRTGNVLRLREYRDTGGVHGAVAKTAEEVYGRLDDHGRVVNRAIFLRLTSLGEGTADTRRRISRQELAGVGTADTVAGVLHQLTSARLVVLGDDTIEVAHEALIGAWPRLRRWLADDREPVRVHRRLTEAAGDWDRGGRDDTYLYRGARLAAWSDRDLGELNELERAFLSASRDQEKREHAAARRRVRVGFTALVAIVVVIGLLAVVAVVQANRAAAERDLALSGQLVANARSQLQVDPELALLLAKHAYEFAPTEEAAIMLRQAVAASYVRGRFNPRHGPAYGVGFDPTSDRFATSGDDGHVRVWEMAGPDATPKLSRTLLGHLGQVWSPVFSPNGRYLAAAGLDGLVLVWDLTTNTPPLVLAGHQDPVWNLTFTPDGSRLASASDDGTVRIWDPTGRQPPAILDTGHGRALGVAAAPDGRHLATSGADGMIRVWDLATLGLVEELAGHSDTVEDIAYSSDGKLASASTDGTARVWRPGTGAEPLLLTGHDGTVEAVAFSPDGTRVATTGNDGTVRIWNANRIGKPLVLRGHNGTVWDVAFDPTGNWLASASHDTTVRFWQATFTGGAPTVRDEQGGMWAAVPSPDGRHLATGGADGVVRVTEPLPEGGKTTALPGHQGDVLTVAWRPDSRWLASAGVDGTLRLWPVNATGTPVVLHGKDKQVRTVIYSPDGSRVASGGSDGTVQLWPASGHGDPVSFHAGNEAVTDLAFAPDGRHLAVASRDGVIWLWPVGRPGPPRLLRGHRGPVTTVAFSADGHTVASAGEDGTVRLWSLATNAEPRVLRGHQGIVWSVAFSPDGTWLASAGDDGTLRMWPAAGGINHVMIDGFGASVEGVTFTGQQIATAHNDGTARIWECEVCGPTGKVLALAKTRTTRQLTDEERRMYLGPEDQPPG
jgi:WD40 repeat protein